MALTGGFALTPAGRAAQGMMGFDGIGAGRRFALVQADPPRLGRPLVNQKIITISCRKSEIWL